MTYQQSSHANRFLRAPVRAGWDQLLLDAATGRYFLLPPTDNRNEAPPPVASVAVHSWTGPFDGVEIGKSAGTDFFAVAEYVLLSVMFRCALRVGGWRRVVWPILRGQQASTDLTLTARVVEVGLKVRSAAFLAVNLPFVSPLCLPGALSMRAMMRRRGFDASLAVGGVAAPVYAFHAWVEVGGFILDPSVNELEYAKFQVITGDATDIDRLSTQALGASRNADPPCE